MRALANYADAWSVSYEDSWEGESPAAIAARHRAEIDFALHHPGFVSSVGTDNGSDENEAIFWNYLVGEARPRQQHVAFLGRLGRKWKTALQHDPHLRIMIIGSASGSSGTARPNRKLAFNRASVLRDILVSQFKIPTNRINVQGLGDQLPLADEQSPDDPMNMARDRRVELFLFTPARVVPRISGVSVPFSSISTSLDLQPNHTLVGPPLEDAQANIYAERLIGIGADGRATWAGPPDSELGFLQFVTFDLRSGTYESPTSGHRLVLDYGRCTTPFLPCRDIFDAGFFFGTTEQPGRNPFEQFVVRGRGSGNVNRVIVKFRDAPGTSLPLAITDPLIGLARLVQSSWTMEFLLILGVRRGQEFLPLDHVTWAVTSNRAFPGTRPLNGGPIAHLTGRGAGAPSGIDISSAMAGATCRLRTRSINDPFLRTRSFDPCRNTPRGLPCPPGVCTPHVFRF